MIFLITGPMSPVMTASRHRSGQQFLQAPARQMQQHTNMINVDLKQLGNLLIAQFLNSPHPDCSGLPLGKLRQQFAKLLNRFMRDNTILRGGCRLP